MPTNTQTYSIINRHKDYTTMDFKSFKSQSSDTARLTSALEKTLSDKTAYTKDPRFWYPETDKAGNAMAIIRFLPAPAVDGEDGLPIVKYFSHSFQGPTGKYYIENSLTTFKQPDPVAEFNSALWNATEDEESPERKQARVQKRKLNYVSNIQIITYPTDPSLEGKHFLFRYGAKIYKKIEEQMYPEFASEKPVIPFDFWEGANFKLIVRKQGEFPNYDSSVFMAPSPLSKDDKVLEALWKSEYSLKEFLDPKNFKSYDELKKRLEDVLDLKNPKVKKKIAAAVVGDDDDKDVAPWDHIETEGDEDEKYFKSLLA